LFRVLRTIQQDFTVFNAEVALGKPADCQGVDAVLLLQHAGSEIRCRITIFYSNGSLRNDGSGIDIVGNEMNGCTVLRRACFECALMGVEPGKGRQQGRVDIYQPSGVVIDEGLAKDAHESGEHNQFGLVFIDQIILNRSYRDR